VPQVAVLDWFFCEGAPLAVEESVVQVNTSLPNQIIPKQIIIIPHLNTQWLTARETSRKRIQFVKSGLTCIQLIIVPFVVRRFTTGDDAVGVGGGADVAGRDGEAFEEVAVDLAHCFSHE